MKYFFKLIIVFVFGAVIISCARKGRPKGGLKDKNAPIFVTAEPPYETTHFSKKKIKISFDEYVTLKDLNKKLVVSPPMKNPPLITPQGTPSKFITIKILDTLLKNTTYIFNFGDAIQDNNEGNKIENFKYVFSTGNYIDSLYSKGEVKDAILKKSENNINVLLYRMDSAFTDSIIYKKKPNYVANTLDSTLYHFSNIKAGNYLLVALKEENSNYLFNPKTEKIGFSSTIISLPKDSVIKLPLTLFKETLPYKLKRGKEASKGKILFSFEGEIKDYKIQLLSNVPKNFKSIYKIEQNKDTINYWFTPVKLDSLNFIVATKEKTDTITVKLRKKKLDSLTVRTTSRGTLRLKDTFFLITNNPIVKIDTSKISLVDKDTLSVKFLTKILSKTNRIAFVFDKKEQERYQISIDPNALTDIYLQENDSLQYRFVTKKTEDYGTIILNVQSQKSEHLIIELLTEKGEVVEKKYLQQSGIIKFETLPPKKYLIRAIIDRNKNNVWDTGNYLNKLQPEKIIYFSEELKIRANWNVNETFTINK